MLPLKTPNQIPNLAKLLLRFSSISFSHPMTSAADAAAAAAAAAAAKVVAEYAKSGRSSCKKCGKAIAAGSLRLGLASRDPRGFDMIKWHHLDCFPRDSELVASVEVIKGFSSLMSCDQEELKKLEMVATLSDKAPVEVHVRKAGEIVTTESEEVVLKKPKLYGPGMDIIFSTSDVKNNYKDASLPPKWKAFQTIIFREKDDELHDSQKIAAFDFDGCLANTSVKKIGADAWSLSYSSIPEKLQSLHNGGYKLVVFTNEANIERWKNKRQQAINSKIGRLDNFIKLVKVPIQVFIACGVGKGKGETDDPFRKPNTGMWTILKKYFNSGIPINMDQSFYVGDAAGRLNDHSDADIRFAQAIGLKFYLPEEYFNA